MFDPAAMLSPAHQTRYAIEHRLMPELFYDDPERIFVGHGPGLFAMLYGRFSAEGPDGARPHAESEFSEETRRFDKDGRSVLIQRVTMPPVQTMTECHAVFFCYERGGRRYYFTSESSFGEGSCLCAWNPDGVHENFGPIEGDVCDVFGRVAELYWERAF